MGKNQMETIQVQVPREKKGGGVPLMFWVLSAIVVGLVLAYFINRMSDEDINRAATIFGASVGGVVVLVVVLFIGIFIGKAAERQNTALKNIQEARNTLGPYGVPTEFMPPAWAAYNFNQPPQLPSPPEYSRPLGQTRSTSARGGGGFVESEPPGDWSDL